MNKLKVSFSDFWGGYDPNNNFWTIIMDKLSIPYEVVNDNSDLLISSCFGYNWQTLTSKKKMFWTGENWYRMDTPIPPLGNRKIIEIFDQVYSFDYNNYQNHFRLPLYLIDLIESGISDLNSILRNKSKDQLYEDFKSSGFCTFVQGNGNCQFRNSYYQALSNIEKVDSYGSLFNNTGIILNREGKIEKTKSYKFALAFENSEYDGYISEKIIDAFKSDIIPIYWGGTKVGSEFNSRAFINVHELGPMESLQKINQIRNNFDLYWEFYNQKIITDDQISLSIRIENFYLNFKNFIQSI